MVMVLPFRVQKEGRDESKFESSFNLVCRLLLSALRRRDAMRHDDDDGGVANYCMKFNPFYINSDLKIEFIQLRACIIAYYKQTAA